jgi:protein-disulfide isomerase
MMKAITAAVAAAAIGLGALYTGFALGRTKPAVSEPAVVAQTAPVTNPAPAELDRDKVGEIVRNYLLDNPELLQEVQVALQKKRDQEARLAASATIKRSSDEIFRSANDAVIGDPNAKVSVVEFFDYNCHYCRGALSDMNEMVESNPDIKFILKEFPILGPDSQRAHVVAIAFHDLMPEKYADFHRKLLGGPGRADEARAIKIAVDLGADEPKLREKMKDPAILDEIRENYKLADALNITGTPSYVIGNEVVFGALGKDHLMQKVANVSN